MQYELDIRLIIKSRSKEKGDKTAVRLSRAYWILRIVALLASLTLVAANSHPVG